MANSVTTDRHANARDRKREKSRKMVVSNRGIFTIRDAIAKRGREAQEKLDKARKERA